MRTPTDPSETAAVTQSSGGFPSWVWKGNRMYTLYSNAPGVTEAINTATATHTVPSGVRGSTSVPGKSTANQLLLAHTARSGLGACGLGSW